MPLESGYHVMLFSSQTIAPTPIRIESTPLAPCGLHAAARSRYPTTMSASGTATISRRRITARTLLPTLATVAQSTHMPVVSMGQRNTS